MSTSTKKQPEAVIPTEEVKKENTKGEKRPHGRTNKGTNATAEKDDRKNKTGHSRQGAPAKRTEGTYIKKAAKDNGDNAASDEENKEQNGEKKNFKPRYEKKTESIYNWNKKDITLETPIPIKPTQKELLAEPKREDLNKQIDAIDAKIEAAKNKKNKTINEIINRDKTAKTEFTNNTEPLHTSLKELFEQQKARKAEHDAALAEYEIREETVKSIFKRTQDLRNKMKKCLPEDDIRDRIEELTFKQQHEQLSSQQEKKIVQEIEELKQSLPHAIPLKKLEDELKTAQKESKAFKGKQGAAYKALKEVREKIDEIKKKLDDLKKFKEESNNQNNPEIELAKKECADLLEELKKQKHETYKKYDADRKAYEDQKELIRYHDYVKKHHEFLKKKELYKKRDEERQKREEEEKALEEEKKKSKYIVYVEIADLLINYLEKLSGKGDKKDYVETTTSNEVVAEKKEIKPEDLNKLLQKEKLTVLVSKKDRTDQSQNIFGGHQKKNQQPKVKETQAKQEKPQEKNVIDAFTHTYDVMEQFEKLSVSAPTFKSEIEKTIALLNEKKQYYIDLPNKETTGTEEQPAEKQEKKGKKQNNKIEFDESAFPTIEN